MPRRARLTLAGIPHHIIQRGNNKQACFYTEDDYRVYLNWLGDYAKLCECQVHAYVLMTNHVHMLVTPSEAGQLSKMMRRLGQRYVQYFNRTYQRSGTLWEGRFKSCIASEESYVLSCYRYIELNPVRACMVDHPAHYPWTSYRVNAKDESSDLVSPQQEYKKLGGNQKLRQAAYRELLLSDTNSDLHEKIRKATKGNFALGSKRFIRQIEQTLGRRVTPGKSGRPGFNRFSKRT